MAAWRNHRRQRHRAPGRRVTLWLALAVGALATGASFGLHAQQIPNPVIALGNAAVAGFSGALSPVQIAPGIDPATMTFIDGKGPSLRVVDLQHMLGPPQAQLVNALKPFSFSASVIGQVFGVALDNQSPPNIYAAATSAYGLPIIAPGRGGQPQHIKTGAPNATFMPGLWGPHGGPGSIWKIDGVSGAVSLFANVTLGSRTNSGPGLGGLAFDPDSKSLFVADRETGFIHRYALDGRELGRYEHGVTARRALGLPSVPWNVEKRIDITSPQFDSSEPATWNYAGPERRIFGLAVYQDRLYYAVAASLQIWSVGLNNDGSFGNDAIIELVVPPSAGPTEISKITFDEQGRMFLAERPEPTGAFDFQALTVPAIGRVLRYAVVGTMPDGRRIWQEQPSEYAIGFPAMLRNGNGGVALGYRYDAKGDLMPAACGGFMWSTGEDLREASDPVLAAKLKQSGSLHVDGLQGNETWRVQRGDEGPRAAYFIDYDDRFDEDAARGHLGDIAIARDCGPRPPPRIDIFPSTPGGPPGRRGGPPRIPTTPPGKPGTPKPPSGSCPPNQARNVTTDECGSCARPNVLVNGKCCPIDALAVISACSNSSCPPGQTAIGPSNFCCDSGHVYTGASGASACCMGTVINGRCQSSNTPPTVTCSPGTPCCGAGYAPSGNSCCLATQMTANGACCPKGQVPSGPSKTQCAPPILIPIGPRCCGAGLVPSADGKCCPSANLTSGGMCCSAAVNAADRSRCPTPTQPACAAGYTRMPDGNCCNNRFISDDGMSCIKRRQPGCATGEFRDASGTCVPVRSPPAPCAPGLALDADGNCVSGHVPPIVVGPGRPRYPHLPPPRPRGFRGAPPRMPIPPARGTFFRR
jgi:hypothetical protein